MRMKRKFSLPMMAMYTWFVDILQITRFGYKDYGKMVILVIADRGSQTERGVDVYFQMPLADRGATAGIRGRTESERPGA